MKTITSKTFCENCSDIFYKTTAPKTFCENCSDIFYKTTVAKIFCKNRVKKTIASKIIKLFENIAPKIFRENRLGVFCKNYSGNYLKNIYKKSEVVCFMKSFSEK